MSENAFINLLLMIASSLLGGIIVGAVTGAGLLWLLRQGAEAESS